MSAHDTTTLFQTVSVGAFKKFSWEIQKQVLGFGIERKRKTKDNSDGSSAQCKSRSRGHRSLGRFIHATSTIKPTFHPLPFP